VHTEVDKLSNHVIVCGYGRIGVALARALKDGGAPLVVLEQSDHRAAEAREAGHLCLQGDATNEAALEAAGIDRARSLATVLPNDAANVFITLSARNLNRDIEIVARGDTVSTERKLGRVLINTPVDGLPEYQPKKRARLLGRAVSKLREHSVTVTVGHCAGTVKNASISTG
jgi:voltage-gated potassium channel